MEEAVKQPGARGPRMSGENRRAQLLDVAERLFIEQGYSDVSIEDIARAAGISRPMIYRHFESKEGALVACIARAYEDYKEALATFVDPDLSVRDQIRAGGILFFSGLERDKGRWLLLFLSPSVLTEPYAGRLAALRFAHIDAIRDLLARAVPGADPQRIEAAAHVISGVGERLGHWWIARPDLSKEEMVDHYVELLMGGITPLLSTD